MTNVSQCLQHCLRYGMCQWILSDGLNKQRVAAKFVPRLLSNDQKEHCIPVCTELKEQAEKDANFISTIITGDECWVFGYKPEMKQQLSQWQTPNSKPKKALQVQGNVKSMLVCFFDTEDIIHKEFVPPGQTVNGKFYCDILRWLKVNIQRKCPDKWCNKPWALQHENILAHASFIV